jgi:hypothetical protein
MIKMTTTTMNTSAPEVKPKTHDFIAHITAISFDFSEYDWEESFESEQKWIKYQLELSNKYSTSSIYFEDYNFPESNEEDETIEEFHESTHGTEEGYYYRILEDWIDSAIGWCLLDLEYRIQKA